MLPTCHRMVRWGNKTFEEPVVMVLCCIKRDDTGPGPFCMLSPAWYFANGFAIKTRT